ncbi:heat shock 70 kDa protein 17 [Nymphaea colorata]|nr:heat shock 70 kDa protein 17 [Nymphaea colorata]
MMKKIGILWKIFLIVCIVSLDRLAPSESAVSSIDLGSEWMKVAVVNLKPGQPPISVAINEMSKRKSPGLVAFLGGDRLLGEEAFGISARYPEKVYSRTRDILAKPFQYVKTLVDSLYLSYDLVEDSRGSAGVRVEDGVVYSAEELVAMVLSYGRNLAGSHAKIGIKDAVIAVPPYFGQSERKELIQAAQLAGINVLGLINEHSGAALQYGIDKDFSNESRHVLFYHMGSSGTYAALAYFSSYPAKEFGRQVSINQFQIKDVRWIAELGGQSMELRLVEHFADEFNAQIGNEVDVRKFPKAMAKLKKQVKRTKEILSANTVSPISVESLYDDRDFRSTITREKFEELCGDLWENSLIPVKEILESSGLKVSDLYAVELIGGATRVPKLQAVLQEFLGRKELDKHLDADEAIVLGAALHAANISDGIKLNRKLGILDGASYALVIEYGGPDLVLEKNSKELLVPRMKKLPSKMFRSLIHSKDFEILLSYDTSEALPPGISTAEISRYEISGLTAASDKYGSRNLSSPIKTNLHFSLSRSGVLSLDRAEAVIEISEWVEIPVKNTTLENSSVLTLNISSEANNEGVSDESKENLENETVNLNQSSTNMDEKNKTEVVTEKKLKRRTFRVPLKIIDKTVGPGMPLSKEFLAEARSRLEALDKKDAERRRTAELKNNLEEYIYATREKLEASGDIEKVSTEQERLSFLEKLNEVQEWLYTDGENAPAGEFKNHLDLLKSVGDPIFFRLSELTARPASCELAKKYFDGLEKIVSDWEEKRTWIPRSRIEEVLREAENTKNWLVEKEDEQGKTSEFSKPMFTSEEVYERLANVQEKVASVNRIPKPKPKIEKPLKNVTANNKTKDPDSSESASPVEPSMEESTPTPDADGSPSDGKNEKEANKDVDSSQRDDGKSETALHDEL